MTGQDEQAVVAATQRFYEALNSMLAGDPEPLVGIYSHADDVNYLPAEGGILHGWQQVYADWSRQAAASRGGSVEPGPVTVVIGSDLAISLAETKGELKLPDGSVVATLVRESSTFRREDGEWKMISHHADDLSAWTGVVEAGD